MKQRRLHVVVPEDDGVLFVFEPVDLAGQPGLVPQLDVGYDAAELGFHLLIHLVNRCTYF